MTRRATGQKGVTLLELLVAMSLFSLLSVAVFFSLRTGLNSLGKVRERVADSRREAGAQRSLELMLAGISLTGVQFVQPGQTTAQNTLFFQGDPAAMRFVSHYSLRDGMRTAPRLIELAVAGNPAGGVRLVMNERVYPGPAAAGAVILGSFPNQSGGMSFQYRPIEIGPATFVVADLLPACRFFYLEQILPQGDIWRAQWQRPGLPKAIRIDMGTRTVTAPVYVAITES